MNVLGSKMPKKCALSIPSLLSDITTMFIERSYSASLHAGVDYTTVIDGRLGSSVFLPKYYQKKKKFPTTLHPKTYYPNTTNIQRLKYLMDRMSTNTTIHLSNHYQKKKIKGVTWLTVMRPRRILKNKNKATVLLLSLSSSVTCIPVQEFKLYDFCFS